MANDEPQKPTIQSRVRSRDSKRNIQDQEEHLFESSLKRSMKSYRSRSIDRDDASERKKSI